VLLEFEPKDIDSYTDYCLITYKDNIPYVDIYEKNG
jgi:hypothetical protein